MTGCPFGFGHGSDIADEADALKSSPKRTKEQGKCPFSGAADADDKDRFDYNKDPISWFYQNQIKSEEQFQAKKAELRAAAVERLENLFEKKGKHLIIDSDNDFSISTSELSAWDSEVYSIRTLASCANSWAEAAGFTAPALLTLRILLLVTIGAACWSAWKAMQSLLQVNHYWGIITDGWLPLASLACASIIAVTTMCLWCMTDTKSKPGLLAGQIGMQVMCGCCTLLATLCWVHPSKVDPKLQSSLCNAQGPRSSDATSRLCHYLPMVQEQIGLAIRNTMLWNSCLSLLALAVACAGSWHLWELVYVEKKAMKHKRRRKQRKNAIPWDKIKVEDIGPVSFCGGAPPAAKAKAAAAASAAAVAAASTQREAKKKV